MVDLPALDVNQGVSVNGVGDTRREGLSIDRQSTAGRHRNLPGDLHHQRAGDLQLALEHADCVAEAVAPK